MPRGKKAPLRGKSQRGAHGGRGGSHLETTFIPFSGSSPRRGQNGFSLEEEARNTERHHSFWNSDQKLRHAKVNFVTARNDDPLEKRDTEAALAGMTLDSSPGEELEVNEGFGAEKVIEEGAEISAIPRLPSQESSSGPPPFIVDTKGGQPIHTGLPPPQARSLSPTPSDSSEEIIVFNGRNNLLRDKSKTRYPSTRAIDVKIRLVEDKIHEKEGLLEEALRKNASPQPPQDSADPLFENILPTKGARLLNRPSRGRAEEEAIITDYISNIDNGNEDLVGNVSFSQRELGGIEGEIWQDEMETSSLNHVRHISHDRAEYRWDRSDICDFDDLSTSDGVMGEVQAIFAKRERQSGAQYLVVWKEQTIDEARWVPATTLTSIGALSHIEKFEAEEKLIAEFQDNNKEDSTDSEDRDFDIDIDIDEDEDNDDERDLVQRKIDRMSDEKIARLLAKQEELGMGSDEVLLFDEAAEDEDDDEIVTSNNPFNAFTHASHKSHSKVRGARRPQGEFPVASALADAYDGFDVMDFDRPSLKKKPKGRKGKLAFDLSDSELEASMQRAWENDRVKKKERKQEREQLRTQGLLADKNGKPELKEKYKEGMGLDAVKGEIRDFLMGGNTTLALPPMDKADRKIVHEIANAFNLKSKSAGDGNKRFPILYRTSRTSAYVERTFAAVEAKLTRRFLPRMDKKSGGTSKGSGRGGGGFNSAAVTYRDGDVVGGSAPELGIENKGRAMLEKMGWSTGTALGALNNKGILQPVSHVVKTSKAGLG